MFAVIFFNKNRLNNFSHIQSKPRIVEENVRYFFFIWHVEHTLLTAHSRLNLQLSFSLFLLLSKFTFLFHFYLSIFKFVSFSSVSVSDMFILSFLTFLFVFTLLCVPLFSLYLCHFETVINKIKYTQPMYDDVCVLR